MEYSLSELKKKYVINVADGKKLGKISDVIFTLPQNCVKGFLVENGPFSLCGKKVGFSVCNIQKIGEDAILVKLENKRCKNSGEQFGHDIGEKKRAGAEVGFSEGGLKGGGFSKGISTNDGFKGEFNFSETEQDE